MKSRVNLKKLSDQVIVVTGASSGIGLETARQAVAAGANVVLSSRNMSALTEVCNELNADGPGRAIGVECDVKSVDQVDHLAARAISEFGRIDTWVNNAGVTIYGKLVEVPLAEKRELFETNFWGVVYGCRAAVKAMGYQGGAIINLGSVLSERVIPLQGMYCATKHAVKAYTDGLRMELEADGYPISVTLIKPAAIDTPYIDHGVSHLSHHPTHAPPVYSPSVVAHAILDSAVHPRRDIYAGGAGKMFWMMENFMPGLTDFVMEKMMMEKGQTDKKLDGGELQPALEQHPRQEGFVRGTYPGHVAEHSAFTEAHIHPVATAAIATGLGLAVAAGISYSLDSRAGKTGNRSKGSKSASRKGRQAADEVVREERITH